MMRYPRYPKIIEDNVNNSHVSTMQMEKNRILPINLKPCIHILHHLEFGVYYTCHSLWDSSMLIYVALLQFQCLQCWWIFRLYLNCYNYEQGCYDHYCAYFFEFMGKNSSETYTLKCQCWLVGFVNATLIFHVYRLFSSKWEFCLFHIFANTCYGQY